MDFRVELQEPAIADLHEIVSYIARDNPAAASAIGNSLLDASLSLAEAPYKGSAYSRIAGVRKLTLRPFKILYRVHEARKLVEILRLWHSARREPKLRAAGDPSRLLSSRRYTWFTYSMGRLRSSTWAELRPLQERKPKK